MRQAKKALLTVLVLGSLLALFAGPLAAEPVAFPSLEALEPLVGEGPELLEALAAMERDEHLRNLQSQRQGPKAFGALAYGYSDEPVNATSEESLSYGNVSARAGVSFPLLGTWSREKIEVLLAELNLLGGRALAEATAERNLTALRKAYALLWIEGRRGEMIEAFLADEAETERLLAERVSRGFLLERDRLEFLSAFDIARRDLVESKLRRTQALQALRLATGRSWEGLPASPPYLPGPIEDGETLLDHVADLADLRYRRDFLELRRRLFETTGRIDREGTVDIGVTAGRDFPGSTGTGLYISFSLREPFGTLGAREDEARLAASADLERERRSAVVARIRVEGELMEALVLREYALASIEAGERRLDAAWEALRVDTLRHGALAGETLEKLQQSRYGYFRVALDLLSAQSLLLQTEAELVRFAFPEGGPPPQSRLLPRSLILPRPLLDPSWLAGRPFPDSPLSRAEGPSLAPPSPGTAPSVAVGPSLPPPALSGGGPSRPEPSPAVAEGHPEPLPPRAASASPGRKEPLDTGLTAYVWDASSFLDSACRAAALERFRNEGFSRMLLSFDAAQIASFRTEGGRRSLEAFLSAARAQGLTVDLLLGDPAWIVPEHRQGLVRLVRELEPFPFRGLHLDLEPDSLPGAAEKRLELAAELVRTLEIVRTQTDRPLALSVHPRELEGELGDVVGPGLEGIPVEEVAVMIYSTRAEAVLERFERIRRQHPGLKLALAQSVESLLSPQESYGAYGREAFRSRAAYLAERLGREGSVGIFVQAWKDYEEMRP